MKTNTRELLESYLADINEAVDEEGNIIDVVKADRVLAALSETFGKKGGMKWKSKT